MNHRDHDRQVKLSGLLIRSALTSTLGLTNDDEVIVNAPARDEEGNFLEPLRFCCQVKIDGQSFEFETWPLFLNVDTTFQINWKVPGAGTVTGLASGYIDDNYQFHFSLWGGRRRFVRALKEATTSSQQNSEILDRILTSTRESRYPN